MEESKYAGDYKGDHIFIINCGYAGFFKSTEGITDDALMQKWHSVESKAYISPGIYKEGLDFFKTIEKSLKKLGFEKVVVFKLGNYLCYGNEKTTMLSDIIP